MSVSLPTVVSYLFRCMLFIPLYYFRIAAFIFKSSSITNKEWHQQRGMIVKRYLQVTMQSQLLEFALMTCPEPLAQPLRFEFSRRTAPNRFLKAAMTERLSSWDPTNLEARGIPLKNLINVYKRWGEGGPGLILTGNIMIELHQLEAAGNPIIPRTCPFSGDRFEAFKEMGRVSRAHGSLIVGQISHPGRQTETRV